MLPLAALSAPFARFGLTFIVDALATFSGPAWVSSLGNKVGHDAVAGGRGQRLRLMMPNVDNGSPVEDDAVIVAWKDVRVSGARKTSR